MMQYEMIQIFQKTKTAWSQMSFLIARSTERDSCICQCFLDCIKRHLQFMSSFSLMENVWNYSLIKSVNCIEKCVKNKEIRF